MNHDQLFDSRKAKGMLRVGIAIAFLAGVIATTAAAQTQVEVDVLIKNGRHQLEEARKAPTQEGYQKAEAIFTEALQIDPNNTEALTDRGLARFEQSGLLAKQGRFDVSGTLTDQAVADFDRAVSLHPNDYKARLTRGFVYSQFPSFLNKGPTSIEDLVTVTKLPRFASESADARARVYLMLGRGYAAAGQTAKAKESFGAAVAISPQSPIGVGAQQELEKLGTTPAAIDSKGRSRPDHFPEINNETSPVIVAATVTLPANASIKDRSSLAPSMQKFLDQLDKQPGLLGTHMLMSVDHPQMLVIMTWWKDKHALNDWFYSDTHQGIIKEYYGAGAQQLSSDSAKGTMRQSGQIGMELFTSLPGSIRYGGGLSPDSAEKKNP